MAVCVLSEIYFTRSTITIVIIIRTEPVITIFDSERSLPRPLLLSPPHI